MHLKMKVYENCTQCKLIYMFKKNTEIYFPCKIFKFYLFLHLDYLETYFVDDLRVDIKKRIIFLQSDAFSFSYIVYRFKISLQYM